MDKQQVIDQVTEFYTKKHRKLEMVARRCGLKNPMDIEDAVHDTMVNAIHMAGTFDPNRGDMGKWLASICQNAVRRIQRADKNNGMGISLQDVDEDELREDFDMEDRMEAEEQLQMVVDKIEAESKMHAVVLKGVLIWGQSCAELSSMTGLTQDNVRKIVQRFREKLGPRSALGS